MMAQVYRCRAAIWLKKQTASLIRENEFATLPCVGRTAATRENVWASRGAGIRCSGKRRWARINAEIRRFRRVSGTTIFVSSSNTDANS
jgi:hypothetical protein